MNVNPSRKEEVNADTFTAVNPRAKVLRMGKRSDDDRGDAPGWYARLKIYQRIEEHGIKAARIATDSGVADATISTCMTRGSGIGLLQIIRLAEYFGVPPGRFLDDALKWWEVQGREHARAVRLAVAQGVEAPKKPTPPAPVVPLPVPSTAGSSTPPPGSTKRASSPPRRRAK